VGAGKRNKWKQRERSNEKTESRLAKEKRDYEKEDEERIRSGRA
jgi:hypothetical protein